MAPSETPPIVQQLPGTVDLLTLHDYRPQRYPYLLESRARGPQARFDILFALPGERLTLYGDGRLEGAARPGNDFLTALDAAWQAEQQPTGDDRLPFQGGWFLFLGYELAGQIERRLALPRCAPDEIVAQAVRFRSALILDHRHKQTLLLAETGQEAALAQMREDLAAIQAMAPHRAETSPTASVAEEEPARYVGAVRRTLDYIRDGDVFQANLSRLWQAQLATACPPSALYRRLRQANPGPFNGLATWDDRAVISSSPERLVEVRNGRIATRPIAGTRPRGEDLGSDEGLSTELLGHPKERAEHIMLIDLERNDLGRVCVPGSIEVDELMTLESYAHVHHIVSNVQGRLRPGVTPGGVIRALFPGGTITGCPKVRCMEIIAELEARPRGAYTGSMGYLNRDGSLDLNILIRTLEQRGRHIAFRAGAGIVADSDPGRELEETRAKARGLLLALGSGGN
ncbi:aminodeoxychorismate synthase component I [Thiohalobacter sp. IOR34]|uniref:aminodeoxychorismate synthase component I n=1 Tax=Thiohalobacter sp. IOR34 TaxID=3057176 RepID=UPI0025B0212B|nr:aminodeoxychorismate synthase component I [Thiohalobacter sp. IOR34]WJW74250.1 aminodeoxychorismate synthase component I [Thiohalobacter sp. IOR34]